MTLEYLTVIDQRTVTEDSFVQIREATYIVDTATGTRVAGPTYHRYVLEPGEDIDHLPLKIRNLCAAEWTPEVVDAFREAKEARAVQLETARKPSYFVSH